MTKLTSILFFSCLSLWVQAKEIKILSPDKKIVLKVSTGLKNEPALNYSVLYQDNLIIAASALGLEFENENALSDNLDFISVKQKLVNETWKPVYGEKNRYLNHYKEAIIQLKELKTPFRSFSITARVYNEGVAFKYTINTKKQLTITAELTGFKFTKDHTSWIAGLAQSNYTRGSISKTANGTERPYVIEMDQSRFIALGEAALTDYPQMKFSRSPKDSLLLLAALGSKAVFNHDFSTPWRYIMVAASAGKLLENNHFILNLNHPSALNEVSWIKPGKVIREVTLTTTGSKACIDFAARHHLQYIELDAGWYGHEYDDASSALAVNVDPSRSPGPLDMQEIIAYGKQKGIGVILYVNQKALSKELDMLLPLYQSWGVKGIKYGFVNVGSQPHISWLHQAVRKAADHQMMLDIHDEYRPTGYSRTYPNLMTQEGVRGDEESPDSKQILTTMFTRMLAGAADMTNCYFAPRVDKMGSHATQMAKAICIYSPWQFVYWYDRPPGSPINKGGAGSAASVIAEIPDLSFYDELPTVWDDTKVIAGKIGEYGTIARRNGNNWYIGSITDKERSFNLPLGFLNKNKKYEATVYADDASLQTATKVAIRRIEVDASTILNIKLLTKNGQAIIIKPLVRRIIQ
ncbi:alpha-glucosidase [Pedobacter steynii]|uniref:Alpha-glucosidase n=1 Tax=Pedobacter steynii TaxID=430522 RepID=A0A1H0CLT7_9SPHI|nr:glycoside hydrolase family 97 protein [Pedobacter steynii]NQX41605.1 glycoside hydrolase family 97 N-terminal domain-containing protein [Pedobacter steynii]SDN58840.1 alpha-glucosidase [Pedobacter steynii]